MVNYENDYIWGEEQQRKIKAILDGTWENLKEQPRYAKYDMISDKVQLEIKSRKGIRWNKYNETLLTMNKIDEVTTTETIFVFNFVYDLALDKKEIFYIKYDREKFSKYRKAMFSRANIKSDEKEYVYIPIEDLTFLYESPERCFLSVGKYKNQNYPSSLAISIN
jgi:hypothetical protein